MTSTGFAADYRRQERALTIGVFSWAVSVSILSTLYPEAVADWILSVRWSTMLGVVLVSLGLYGAIADAALRIIMEPESGPPLEGLA